MTARDWVERELGRPLTLRQRQLAFTATAILLALCALLLSVTGVGVPRQRGTRATGKRPLPTVSAPTQAPPQALWVARRFLSSYLRFVYGQRPASTITDATTSLRSALDRRLHPAPPALRQLRPRIVSLKAETSEVSAITVSALVKDREVLAYPITLVLHRTGSQLLVARVGDG